jgi:hypothetical protein
MDGKRRRLNKDARSMDRSVLSVTFASRRSLGPRGTPRDKGGSPSGHDRTLGRSGAASRRPARSLDALQAQRSCREHSTITSAQMTPYSTSVRPAVSALTDASNTSRRACAGPGTVGLARRNNRRSGHFGTAVESPLNLAGRRRTSAHRHQPGAESAAESFAPTRLGRLRGRRGNAGRRFRNTSRV